MSAQNLALTRPALSFAWLRELWRTNRPLTLIAIGSLALLAATILLAALDPRQITGAPAWIKPLKFSISTVFYTLTLAWMLRYVPARPRLVALVSWATALGLLVELALIVMQVVRGVRSHFNVSTAFDGAVFSIMGSTIVLIWIMNLLAALLLVFQKLPDRAFAWSLRLGLLVTLYGAGVAFLMTAPTSAQMAQMQSGAAPTYIGAHSVGVDDGGPGLPLLGWSTTGGDLRIPHFFGLHALQVIPLAGWLINTRLAAGRDERRRTALVWTAGLAYLGFTLLVTWQALRGQPLLAPDALTLTALAGLLAAALAAGLYLLRPARRLLSQP